MESNSGSKYLLNIYPRAQTDLDYIFRYISLELGNPDAAESLMDDMENSPDLLPVAALPQFLEETELLLEWLQSLTYAEEKSLWKCNDRLAELNFERLRHMDLYHNLTPAIVAYEGIQYQYMAPSVFTQDELSYVEEHLRILSGFYGVLRPFDGVTPYRLEMQAKAAVEGNRGLYAFWGDRETAYINL